MISVVFSQPAAKYFPAGYFALDVCSTDLCTPQRTYSLHLLFVYYLPLLYNPKKSALGPEKIDVKLVTELRNISHEGEENGIFLKIIDRLEKIYKNTKTLL